MIRTRILLSMAGTIVCISMPAFAQQEMGSERNEFSVQAVGSFVETTTSNGIQQSATNSGGVLVSYRFFFNNHNGVEADYGFTRNSQNYSSTDAATGVNTSSYEFSAAYVFRVPRKHWAPFVLAGVGGLAFDPQYVPGASTQTRAAFIYGGGADFNLTKRIYLRAQYRGFVYDSPTFGLSALDGTSRVTHRAEPSIGFGFRL